MNNHLPRGFQPNGEYWLRQLLNKQLTLKFQKLFGRLTRHVPDEFGYPIVLLGGWIGGNL